MQKVDDFLKNNKIWAEKSKIDNPAYFEEMAKEQKPELLWIGCSDSRVPAEIVVNAKPGEMFIHRNIANQVIATDFNCLSVMQYAVNVLQVKHIVVCGHYYCGGVRAALAKQNASLLITNKWLMHIKNVYRLHQNEIDAMPSEDERVNKLVEFNILEQVHALSHTSIVQEAWSKQRRPVLHGWVYNLKDGLLKPLIKMNPGDHIHPIYECEFAGS
ncbi:carbonic anhydrase [Methylomarinum vadi]|uniref:carbonic anhydrase n=1 Tax=Methylomarinum vadi TaxID=438855 RepID=UPI0004DF3520|nr:carbonic anhydrase [Methylomarinum vadi]